MTHKAKPSRNLTTEALARVEGEGAMRVEIRDGQVDQVQLNIYEPPRFFEGFLRGRSYREPPDITARICGICPVAYQMSACRAIEDALGMEVDGQLRELRRLLYCAEWIESHILHIHFLHLPDFFGLDSAVELAGINRPAVERALLLKKIGNELLELIGGRAIHPVNIRVGGFYRAPSRRELLAFRPRLEQARELAAEVVELVGVLDFPDLDVDHEMVALRHPTEYAILDGRIVSDRGLDIPEADYPDHFVEEHKEHSTALFSRLRERGAYLVGPLARYSLNSDRLTSTASAAAKAVGLSSECRNPFRSIVVRAVETLDVIEVALAIIDAYDDPDQPYVEAPAISGTGHGATEAPRGLLYHRYTLDGDGTITDAVITPPTSQNQAAIEHDLTSYVQANIDQEDEELRRGAEVVIRNHDPCISCATHFLDLAVVRR